MKRKFTIGLLLSLAILLHFQAFSQNKTKPLSVGDSLPGIFISNILNSSKPVRKIQDEPSMPLIIDFWSPYCGYSVEIFRELDHIQQLYKEKLEIIRVTRKTEADLRKLFIRSESAASSKLPLVFSDSTLKEFFPIELPHQVWVDNKGVIRAIVNAQDFTEENVKKLIENEDLGLLPMDHFQDFNPSEPLFLQAKISFRDNVAQFSYYTKYINGINEKTGSTIDPVTRKIIRRAYYNMSVKNLIQLAYDNFGSGGKYGLLSDNRKIIYERGDPERFFTPEDKNDLTEWQWNNTFCYEIQVLPENSGRIAEMMQQDLKRFFNITVSEEIRIVDGYRLLLIDKEKVPLSGGRGRGLTLVNQKTGIYTLENQSVKELVKSLGGVLRSSIVVDETNFKEKLQLQYKRSDNIQEMIAELRQFGFDLVPGKVEVPMLVVR